MKEPCTSKRRKARSAAVKPAKPSHPQTPAAALAAAVSAPFTWGPGVAAELLRRCALVLVVGLMVARPIVLGEDPGLLADDSDAGGLLLTLLWFVTALVWAVWRVWARRGDWRGGLVEAGLLVAVGCYFLSTFVEAPYRHPARLISWEWLALLVGLFLVRQLAVDPDEQRRLTAVLLAGAVAISANTVYQGLVEIPDLQKQYPNVEKVGAARGTDPDDPRTEAFLKRIQDGHAYGTFAHPNSLGGYLALCLPPLVVAVVLLRQQGGPGGAGWGGLALVLLVAGALWLSHSRGALLAVALVGVAGFAVWRRRVLWAHRTTAVATLFVLAVAGVGLYSLGAIDSALGKNTGTAAVRLEYWSATWSLIGDHPWLGVGPGNFGNAYHRYMAPTAAETIQDPHNFFLEVWSSAGLVAAAAVLFALGAFFYRVLRGARPVNIPAAAPANVPAAAGANAPSTSVQTAPPTAVATAPTAADLGLPPLPQGMEPVRLEFYLAGMMGLLLSFLLIRTPDADKNQMLVEGFPAAVRIVVWFFAFAVLERVPWDGRTRALALLAGVAALLINLLVSGGIGFPSVAGPLWTAVALGLNAVDARPQRPGPSEALSLYGPPPLLAVLAIWYGMFVFYPVVYATHHARGAEENAKKWSGTASERRDPGIVRGRTAEASQVRFLQDNVIAPLEKAVQTDPDNARWYVQLAYWYGRINDLSPPHDGQTPPGQVYAKGQTKTAEMSQMPLLYATAAQETDPQGRQGYWSEYTLRRESARRVRDEALRDLARAPVAGCDLGYLRRCWQGVSLANELAAKALGEYLRSDPRDAPLHLARAEALLDSGEVPGALEAAGRAVEFDQQAAGMRKILDPRPFVALAEAASRTGKPDQARALAVHGLEVDARLPPRAPRKLTDRQRSMLRELL
jgi:O-antigen ligase